MQGHRRRSLPVFLAGAISLLVITASSLFAQEATGRVAGRIVESDGVTPIAGAQVFVLSSSAGAITGDDGRFVIARAPLGSQTVRASMLGYADRESVVVVSAEAPVNLTLTLETSVVELAGLTVAAQRRAGSAVALDAERRSASIVQDAIGREQIERSADGDAAAVASRTPGVTVVGGKYVYVRGLGERYGNATLNGSPLATPEPDRRTVPLDLIPARFLESVVTAKTYSPDHPGDYAGGLIQLRTRGYPPFGLFRVDGSVGFDSEATFGSGLMHAAGGLDAFGMNGRDLPAGIARDVELRDGVYTPEELERIGESFAPGWGAAGRELPANRSLAVTLGDSWRVGDAQRPLGFLATASWSNAWRNRAAEIERVFASGGAAEPEVDYLGTTSTQSIALGGMLELAYEPVDGHDLSLTSVFSRVADDEARRLDGFVLDANANLRTHRLQHLAQSLLSTQVRGEHAFGAFDVDWRLDARAASRLEPNTREVLYLQGADGVYRWESFIQSGSVFHQDLAEHGWGGAFDVRVPLGGATRDASLAVGSSADTRTRDVYTRRFRFIPQSALAASTRELSPDQLFSSAHIAPDSFQIQEATFAGDNYEAGQSVFAGYAMIETPLRGRLHLSAGARIEAAAQRVDPVDVFDSWTAPLDGARLDDVDVLPALNLTYALSEVMNLRFGASRTLARPQFRELAPFAYADYAGGHLVRGNPILERTGIANFDARWEWFPELGSVIAVSAFQKRFEAPIEVLVFQQGAELAKTWVNASGADNYGLEVELRSGLGRLSHRLESLGVNANLTLVRSVVRSDAAVRVTLPETGTLDFDVARDRRALQGQSPYVLNLGATWTSPRGTSASVLFNRFGRRIDGVGVQPLPDIYEEARSSLDLVLERSIGGKWSVELSAERLIGGDVRFTQGGDLLRSHEPGRLFTVSVSWGGGE